MGRRFVGRRFGKEISLFGQGWERDQSPGFHTHTHTHVLNRDPCGENADVSVQTAMGSDARSGVEPIHIDPAESWQSAIQPRNPINDTFPYGHFSEAKDIPISDSGSQTILLTVFGFQG